MSLFKAVSADLQNDVVSIYDQTKTTIKAFFEQLVIAGVPTIGVPMNKFVDVFTDAGETPLVVRYTQNNRLFCVTAISGGLARITLHNFDKVTGAYSYVGKIITTFANSASTTHTIADARVDDTNPNSIEILITTRGSVTTNGGLFWVHKLNISDFTQLAPITIPFASGFDQKAVYKLHNILGAANDLITGVSMFMKRSTKEIYIQNGSAATYQIFKFSYAGTPNCEQTAVTLSIASPGKVNFTAHPFAVNDQVQLSTDGALPTGLNTTTVYFVRNLTANDFELSTTSGGSSINFTGSQSGTHTIRRAFGQTADAFVFKTGNLPSVSGTLLTNGSGVYVNNPDHTPNAGFESLFFATTTNLMMGRVSELSSGVTAWPSLFTANVLGPANESVVPVPTICTYDEKLDLAVFNTNGSKFISKRLINNIFDAKFGILNNNYMETVVGIGTDVAQVFGLTTIVDLTASDGWTFVAGSAVGQRGVLAIPSSADSIKGTSYFITKVLDTSQAKSFVGVALSQQLPNETCHPNVYYRTSGFGSESGGWILLPKNLLMTHILPAEQIQFKVDANILDIHTPNALQVIDMFLGFLSKFSNSSSWNGDVENSTKSNESPSRSAAILIKAYPVSVPKIKFTAYSRATGSLVRERNTVDHAAEFEYSNNSGLSWFSLGTIPNVINTTRLRYNWGSPIGEDVDIVWSEG